MATLHEPAKSHNKFLNVVFDTTSHSQIAKLLEKYTGKKVEMDVLGEAKALEIWDDPSKARKEHTKSAFLIDFRYLANGTQGEGEFVRPKSRRHDDLCIIRRIL